MILVKHRDGIYILCNEVKEYGNVDDPWVTLMNYIALDTLPKSKELKIIWKHVQKDTGYCTTKKSIKIIKEIV